VQPHELPPRPNVHPPYHHPAPNGSHAVPPAEMPAYLRAATSPDALDQLRRRGRRQIIFGVLWLVGGIAATLWSLSIGASFYVVYWGPVLYGLVSVVLGARKVAKSQGG
jgi:hypothetical protein